jgi:hypothetical protein
LNDIAHYRIPISYLNPLALGHVMNHPPPDKAPNVKLIDFDVPFTFFPTDFMRYFPFVFRTNEAVVYFNLEKREISFEENKRCCYCCDRGN